LLYGKLLFILASLDQLHLSSAWMRKNPLVSFLSEVIELKELTMSGYSVYTCTVYELIGSV